ncbi:MAG: type II toxin-antitoxin system RelE/ParE family toxin [Microcystaceae cyanobacterium]
MRKPYRLTKQAANDLKDIWHYTADTHSETQADIYLTALKTGCVKIAENPNRWRILKLENCEVRFYLCEHHYIVYLASGTKDTEVVILAFLLDILTGLKPQ